MVSSAPSSTKHRENLRAGVLLRVLLIAAVVIVSLGTGLGFVRAHLVQIRELEPSLPIQFNEDPVADVCLLVGLQAAIVGLGLWVLSRWIHRAACWLLAGLLAGLSFTSIGWIHLLGREGIRYVPAESLTTAREAQRAIPLDPAEGTNGFTLQEPKRLLYAPIGPVWTAAPGPAKFVSAPLPAETLPILRIIFHSTGTLPDGFLYLESATGDRASLSVARFAQDRWQFGHVSLPSGGSVRLIVDLPAANRGFALQNPIPVSRGVWLSHALLKTAPWLLAMGLGLFAGALAVEWPHRTVTLDWLGAKLAQVERGVLTLGALVSPARRLVASRRFAVIALALVFVALAWRQTRYVDDYAVNIMSWDQWDFYRPLFDGRGWWATFTQQHGPHRQGIGFVVTRAFAEMTGWNARGDAFLVSTFLIAAAALGLPLVRRFGGGVTLAWIAVPLLVFNVRQDPAIIGAANLSHGSMPVFLITAIGLSWFVERTWLRYLLVCALTFLVVFTGFGLFMGVVTPLLFALDGVHAFRSKKRRELAFAVAGLVAVAATWMAFRHGYKFDPAIGDFRFPYEKPWEYVEFCAILVSFFLGIPGTSPLAMTIGFAGLVVLSAVGIHSAWRLLRVGPARDPRNAVIFSFAAFTLIFCFNTAVGRVMGGLANALAHRYVTLLIPGGFAVLLYFLSRPTPRLGQRAALWYAVILAVGTTWLRDSEWEFSRLERDGRVEWKRAYLETRNEILADQRSHFSIYPGSVKARLEFLERRQLNLFNPAAKP